jgi:predicted nucleotidyltransferase
MERFGLPEKTIERIRAVLAHYPSIERAVIYGSRAKGTYKPGSDIDLVLFGQGLTETELLDLGSRLDDLLLPYTFDFRKRVYNLKEFDEHENEA